MNDVVWGEPIEVNGARPSWLKPDDGDGGEIKYRGKWFPQIGKYGNWAWGGVEAIRLPASHPYYTVQRYNADHGTSFVYWPGGDAAPADWDGGTILTFRGIDEFGDWVQDWDRTDGTFDIIGYTSRTEPQPATDDSDYVRVKRMTEAEASEIWNAERRVNKAGSTTTVRSFLDVLTELGVIKPEPTEAERIAAKTGLTPEQVQAVLDAQNA